MKKLAEFAVVTIQPQENCTLGLIPKAQIQALAKQAVKYLAEVVKTAAKDPIAAVKEYNTSIYDGCEMAINLAQGFVARSPKEAALDYVRKHGGLVARTNYAEGTKVQYIRLDREVVVGVIKTATI